MLWVFALTLLQIRWAKQKLVKYVNVQNKNKTLKLYLLLPIRLSCDDMKKCLSCCNWWRKHWACKLLMSFKNKTKPWMFPSLSKIKKDLILFAWKMENLPLLGLLLKWLKRPRPEPGVASGSLRVLAIVHCFPRHIIRELDWKLSNQDSNWLPIWNTDVAIRSVA